MKKDTIIRIIVLVLVAAANIFNTAVGKQVVDPTLVESVVSNGSILVFTAVAFWCAWKNNSVTSAAQCGDKIMELVKQGTVTAEQVETIINQIEAEVK